MKLFPRRLAIAATVLVAPLFAQSPGPSSGSAAAPGFDQVTSGELVRQADDLLKQAQASPSGLASVTLKRYPHYFTMLTVRTRSGGAEQHDHYSDIFIALDGEATVLVGGSIPDSKASSPGELRGARVAGGTEHVMHKGDIVHISPGVPHQTLVEPGKTFTYYVVKVAAE